ncbi:MAG: prolipoprotein diacylglyceryl transferase [Oscillospiraceae bacterium]
MRDAVISFPMFGENFAIDPPYCFAIGNFKIYFYGVIIALGFVLAIVYAAKNCRRFDITMDTVYDLLLWAVIAAIIGARAYYCVFNWELYADDPISVFSIRDGGLAIYGGVIGAVLALIIACRVKKISVWPALDIMSFGLLIGQAVGRWGNFFNREAYGYETDVFCRMGLTLNGRTIYVHPTFLYESLWNLAGLVLLHFYSKKHRKYQGQFFFLYVFWYGLGRAFIEGLRSDSLWLIPDVIRVSQLLAVVSMLAALALCLVNARRVKAGRAPLLGRALDGGDIIEEKANESVPGDDAAPIQDETETNQDHKEDP